MFHTLLEDSSTQINFHIFSLSLSDEAPPLTILGKIGKVEQAKQIGGKCLTESIKGASNYNT